MAVFNQNITLSKSENQFKKKFTVKTSLVQD